MLEVDDELAQEARGAPAARNAAAGDLHGYASHSDTRAATSTIAIEQSTATNETKT